MVEYRLILILLGPQIASIFPSINTGKEDEMDELLKVLLKPEVISSGALTILLAMRSFLQGNAWKKLTNKKVAVNSEDIRKQGMVVDNMREDLNRLLDINQDLQEALLKQVAFHQERVDMMEKRHADELQRVRLEAKRGVA